MVVISQSSAHVTEMSRIAMRNHRTSVNRQPALPPRTSQPNPTCPHRKSQPMKVSTKILQGPWRCWPPARVKENRHPETRQNALTLTTASPVGSCAPVSGRSRRGRHPELRCRRTSSPTWPAPPPSMSSDPARPLLAHDRQRHRGRQQHLAQHHRGSGQRAARPATARRAHHLLAAAERPGGSHRPQYAAADPKRNTSLAHDDQFTITEQGNLITCALDGDAWPPCAWASPTGKARPSTCSSRRPGRWNGCWPSRQQPPHTSWWQTRRFSSPPDRRRSHRGRAQARPPSPTPTGRVLRARNRQTGHHRRRQPQGAARSLRRAHHLPVAQDRDPHQGKQPPSPPRPRPSNTSMPLRSTTSKGWTKALTSPCSRRPAVSAMRSMPSGTGPTPKPSSSASRSR